LDLTFAIACWNAATKFCALMRQHRLPIKVYPNDGRVVSNFIMQALRNEDITVYGDGNQTRSFYRVHDSRARRIGDWAHGVLIEDRLPTAARGRSQAAALP
jgi:hypothetical protein